MRQTTDFMNGVETNLADADFQGIATLAVHLRVGVPERVLGSMNAPRRCPSCNSIVYARRHEWCGVCGRTLPKSCLFTPSEARQVELLLNHERERHRQWLRRR
jgi:hypothetical protein